jgi:hypothetical protein
MKKSELAKAIKETIIEVLQEATIETSAKDLDQVKASADKDDVIKVTEDWKRAAEKTKDRLANRKSMADFERSGKEFKDVDDEYDKEPTSSQLRNEPISKIGYKLADTQKEMKQVVKKWKTAEGAEKERLTNRLRDLTKIKKELEGLL